MSASSDSTATSATSSHVPQEDRDASTVAGHWLLARLGKRVLRPGGVELTRRLLAAVRVGGIDIVELAPGLGRTAGEIVARGPRSYIGVDEDPDAAAAVNRIVVHRGEVRVAKASATGLPPASADVVLGEAMLTMQGSTTKAAIIEEARRLLRPGGRYVIHELALTPDDLPREVAIDIRQALARSIRVNARPLTVTEWTAVLAEHGLAVEQVLTAPMALLRARRLIADEGVPGSLRFARNLIAQPAARRRVLEMRRTFRTHRRHLVAVGIVARMPDDGATSS